jgi:hypothetical protein
MARKNRTFRLDERVIDLIADFAKSDGRSTNQWLERLIWEMGKQTGKLSQDDDL